MQADELAESNKQLEERVSEGVAELNASGDCAGSCHPSLPIS